MTREDGSPLAVDELPGRRAVLGEPAEPTLTRSVNLDTGAEYWLLTKATVVHDEDGRPLAVNIIQDVTVAKETERRQRFLAEAGRLLASSLDCERTLAEVARLAVPTLGDWCTIDLAGDDGVLERVAAAHADPAKVALVRRLRAEHPRRRRGRRGVAPRGAQRARGAARAASTTRARGGRRRRATRGARARHALGDRRADAIGRAHPRRHLVVTSDSRRELNAGDLAFVEDLALRAGAAVENARLYSEQAHTAQTLQDSLLPSRLPELARFRAASSYRAGGAGAPSAATSTTSSRSAAARWCCSATSPARASTRPP